MLLRNLVNPGSLDGIDIRLVDDHEGGHAEMRGQLQHARHVMDARNRGFGDNQDEVTPGDRRDDRASGSRRAIAENPFGTQFSGKFSGTVAYLRDKAS